MVQTITAAELVTLLATQGLELDLIDVRDQNEWDAGHIEGSRLVPLPQLRADPEAALVRGKTLIFICAKGVRSMQGAKLAERFGYEHIYNLEGGTKEWASAGYALALDTRVAA